MKFKKEIYVVGILFIFVSGYFLGLNSREENSINRKIEQQEKKEEDIPHKNTGKELYKILDVVDGDTVKINYEGKKISVRILGINTPEKKNPFRPQECFGTEASKKAKEILWGKKVSIETDDNKSKFDKFGRLLGYVNIEGGGDFGEKMIRDGYAYEYTYHGRKYKNQKKYKEAQKYAEENELGLWDPNTCNGEK